MVTRILSTVSLILSALLLFLHLIAIKYFFYLSIGWYDSMMHLIGGASIAALSLWFLYNFKPHFSARFVFLYALFLSLVVGIFWEIFERFIDLAQHVYLSYPFDTAKDIIMDLLGASFFTSIFLKTHYFSFGKNDR